ncbi:uncharacterized protein LOC105848653 [Hydra vulgaris]|uniref:uncharacterized protein LOC105848653 n=1 Tax=Hydra vulgaris TaxID=6087 RepID=UPI001F5F8248|nr:uncharacterized protein LOC105848653 isoform X3 [Hydra vulgaris]
MGQFFTYFRIDENFIRSQEFKLRFSESVGRDWRTLGRWLNIDESSLESINEDNNNTNEKAYLMLTKWIQMNDNPTFIKLITALRNMRRMDLIERVNELTKPSILRNIALLAVFGASIALLINFATTLNNPKPDLSKLSVELKQFYLKNYGKISELQPLLKAPANVDLIHTFVDLCIVDAVNAQMDAVASVEQKNFFEKQMSYTPKSYSEIFMEEKSVILISGIAGIGKTWLLRKCLLDWSNNTIWKNVKFVFYLEFRRLNQYPHISTEVRKYKHVVAGRVYAIDQYQHI